jgi:hypothetical protein
MPLIITEAGFCSEVLISRTDTFEKVDAIDGSWLDQDYRHHSMAIDRLPRSGELFIF